MADYMYHIYIISAAGGLYALYIYNLSSWRIICIIYIISAAGGLRRDLRDVRVQVDLESRRNLSKSAHKPPATWVIACVLRVNYGSIKGQLRVN